MSLEDLAAKTDNPRLKVLAEALDAANGRYLERNRSPSRKVHELDNPGSSFYLALYWAEALAEQTRDASLQAEFRPVAEQLAAHREQIIYELNEAQGNPVDIGGYYHADPAKVREAMRPSPTLNRIIDAEVAGFNAKYKELGLPALILPGEKGARP